MYTENENINRNALKFMLGEEFYEEQMKPIKSAVKLVATSRDEGFREAAATLAQVAMTEGEDPIISSMFIAAGAELANAA